MGRNYTALSGTDMISGIRKKNIGSLFLCLLGILLAVGILYFAGYQFRESAYFYGLMSLALGIGIVIAAIAGAISAFRTLGNITNCRVFRKYGTPDELAGCISEGSTQTILDSKQALITESFIMKHGDFESFVPFSEILLLYRKEHRTNGILDSIFLVVHDRYGDKYEYPFKLGKKHAGEMDMVANVIAQQAPDCRFGYTPQNLQYVKQNAQKL